MRRYASAAAVHLLVEPSSVAGGAIILQESPSQRFSMPGDDKSSPESDGNSSKIHLKWAKTPDFMVQDTSDHVKNAIKINPLIFSAIADEALLNAKVNIAYHTMPATLDWNGSSWDVGLCTKDGLVQVRASVIIDCTGDANATKIAGYQVLSPDYCQPGTFSFHATGYQFDQIDFNELANDFYTAIQNGTLKLEDVGWATTAPPDNPNWVKSFFWHFFGRQGKNTNHISWINAYSSERKTQMDIEGVPRHRLFRFLKGRGLKPTFNQSRNKQGHGKLGESLEKLQSPKTTTLQGESSQAHLLQFLPHRPPRPKMRTHRRRSSQASCQLYQGALIPKNSANFLGWDGSSHLKSRKQRRIRQHAWRRTSRGSYQTMAVKLNQQPRKSQSGNCDSLRKQNAIVPSIPDMLSARRLPLWFSPRKPCFRAGRTRIVHMSPIGSLKYLGAKSQSSSRRACPIAVNLHISP